MNLLHSDKDYTVLFILGVLSSEFVSDFKVRYLSKEYNRFRLQKILLFSYVNTLHKVPVLTAGSVSSGMGQCAVIS